MNINEKNECISMRFGDIVYEMTKSYNSIYNNNGFGSTIYADASLEERYVDGVITKEDLKDYFIKKGGIVTLELYITDFPHSFVQINFPKIEMNVFDKLPNGLSLIDCIDVNSFAIANNFGSYDSFTSITINDIKKLYDIEVSIPLITLNEDSNLFTQEMEVSCIDYDIYINAIMNCINKNGRQRN